MARRSARARCRSSRRCWLGTPSAALSAPVAARCARWRKVATRQWRRVRLRQEWPTRPQPEAPDLAIRPLHTEVHGRTYTPPVAEVNTLLYGVPHDQTADGTGLD